MLVSSQQVRESKKRWLLMAPPLQRVDSLSATFQKDSTEKVKEDSGPKRENSIETDADFSYF